MMNTADTGPFGTASAVQPHSETESKPSHALRAMEQRPSPVSCNLDMRASDPPFHNLLTPTEASSDSPREILSATNADTCRLQSRLKVGLEASPTAATPDLDLTNNPIRNDPTLKALVEEKLAEVNSYRSFKLWKSSFLNRFETFLTEDGAPLAAEQYSIFTVSVESLAKYVAQLQTYVERGDLSIDRTTVRGRNSLNEMNKCLVAVMEQERDLIPARSTDEKRLGYSKFHLGAVLVRDGFREHERLHHCYEVLATLKECTDLKHVADRQQLDEIENFEKQLIRFRDIMYDLGMLEIMLKSRQYGNPEDELIFVDLKTGALGTVTVGSCLDKMVLHRQEVGAETPYREAVIDPEERQSILDLVKEALANKEL